MVLPPNLRSCGTCLLCDDRLLANVPWCAQLKPSILWSINGGLVRINRTLYFKRSCAQVSLEHYRWEIDWSLSAWHASFGTFNSCLDTPSGQLFNRRWFQKLARVEHYDWGKMRCWYPSGGFPDKKSFWFCRCDCLYMGSILWFAGLTEIHSRHNIRHSWGRRRLVEKVGKTKYILFSRPPWIHLWQDLQSLRHWKHLRPHAFLCSDPISIRGIQLLLLWRSCKS